jgi:AraC-like DNA-binding protein
MYRITLPQTMDNPPNRAEPAKSPQLAISEVEVRDYLGAFPALDREAIVSAMIARGPWRADVERQLREMCDGYRVSRQAGLSESRLHTILRFIESSPDLRLSVAEMAAAVHLSPFHFSRAFTKTVGQSPHAYLTLRRIERAKLLIARGEMSLSAIATQVGFRTQAHFTGVFSRFVGVTPSRYRQTVSRRNNDRGMDAWRGGPAS